MSRLSAEIEGAFRSGALILTANLRAARWLRQEYALRMRRQGRQAWTTPPIEDWDSWIRRLWHAASLLEAAAGLFEKDPPLLLTELQEHRLWLRMQRDDANLLVSPEGMARLAAGAYSLLCSCEARAERNHAWAQTDAERFQQWAAAFDRECGRQRWLSRGHLESRLASALHDGALTLPENILLVGFDRLQPAQQTLLTALRARGVVISTGQTEGSAQIQLLRADDLREEITTCAWWARRLLESPGDGIRIGIVVPELGAARGEMERTFRRVLMPESDDISASTVAMPFEFSLGQPLATVPVIKAALLVLRWAAAPLREEELSWLLLSGFLTATDAETLAAARFDASLREAPSLSMEISLSSLRRQLHLGRLAALRDLQERLLQIEKLLAANDFSNALREPSRWVDLAQSVLKLAAWPGGRALDAVQFQAMAKWERALEDIALLDYDGRLLPFSEFLRILAAHAGETLFAMESTGAPVQIMGVLEASGQRFDALWFLGADDASWPLRGRMHPLLPFDVQQRTNMPHATPQADFELSLTVSKSLAAAAPRIVISHAARNKDGEQRPSPLVSLIAPGLPWQTSPDWRALLYIPEDDHSPAEMEEIADASGVIAWPREQSAGGSEVLADQAACPFRAFAAKRLAARPLNRSDWGLNAAQRGNLLHKVMERIWSPSIGHLHTLADLLTARSEERLHGIVDRAIAEVFEKEIDAYTSVDPWLQAYVHSERQTLCKRIEEWLDEEAKRVPFTVIATEEKLNDVNVGGLKLRLRADRIDEVADFARLLIDYKTGLEVRTADWNPPRPSQPQLPLYAVFGKVDDVRGLLFARLRAGKVCFTGKVTHATTQLFANAKGNSALVKDPYTEAERDEWSAALVSLANEFLRGEAIVDPKDGRKTCQHCPLPGLCRVAETPAALDEDETEPGDA